MICAKCGKQLKENAVICFWCGAPVGAAGEPGHETELLERLYGIKSEPSDSEMNTKKVAERAPIVRAIPDPPLHEHDSPFSRFPVLTLFGQILRVAAVVCPILGLLLISSIGIAGFVGSALLGLVIWVYAEITGVMLSIEKNTYESQKSLAALVRASEPLMTDKRT